MSGGSFNYLCRATDLDGLVERRCSLEAMAEELAALGYAQDAARETEELLLMLRQWEVRAAVRVERLRDVWKAVEWWRSCDYSEDQVHEALAEYRGDGQSAEQPTKVACTALHTDGQGNTLPCPGYPHAEPEPEAPKVKPRASVIEIIAKDQQPTEDGAGSIVVPREVRINGVSVYTANGGVVKISDVQLGNNVVTVNLTLVVRRLVIAADGDPGQAP